MIPQFRLQVGKFNQIFSGFEVKSKIKSSGYSAAVYVVFGFHPSKGVAVADF